MAQRPRLVIGTRGSPLALAQTNIARESILRAHPDLASPGAIEVRTIRTSGDRITDRPLAELGGKGLFIKEIEEALRDGAIDLAVHSMKDMPAELPPGLDVACLLPREDPRDVLACPGARARKLAEIPAGARLGTSSLRRQAQVLALRPDIKIVPLRGNVGTRLRKLKEGEVEATLLALAGLRRLGLMEDSFAVLSTAEMLPAVGQGAIGIETRAGDDRVRELLAPLNHGPTATCITAERALLAALGGSCRTPIAGFAELDPGGRITIRGLLATPDGVRVFRAERAGPAHDGERLGADAGAELRARAGDDLLRSLA